MSGLPVLRPAVASGPSLPALQSRPMLMPTALPRYAAPTPGQRLGALTRLLAVVAVHAALLGTIASHMDTVAPQVPTSIEVALIAPPAPVPMSPPRVETPPSPPKPVEPPRPVVKKVAPKPKPTPRPKPEKAISEPQPETPAPVAEAAPAVESAPVAPIKAPPGPAVAAPQPVVEPRFDAAYLNNPRPVYPRLSRRLGEQGKVLLRVFVSADGRAEDVRLHQSSGHKRLDEAARDAVSHWRFVPAKRGDEAVAGWFIVPIEFKLEDA